MKSMTSVLQPQSTPIHLKNVIVYNPSTSIRPTAPSSSQPSKISPKSRNTWNPRIIHLDSDEDEVIDENNITALTDDSISSKDAKDDPLRIESSVKSIEHSSQQLSQEVINRFIYDIINDGDYKFPVGWTDEEVQQKVLDEILRIKHRAVLSEDISVGMIKTALEINAPQVARDFSMNQPYKDLEQSDEGSFITGDINLITLHPRHDIDGQLRNKSKNKITKISKPSIKLKNKQKDQPTAHSVIDDNSFAKAVEEIERIRLRMINNASKALRHDSKDHITDQKHFTNHLMRRIPSMNNHRNSTSRPIDSSRSDKTSSYSDLFTAYEKSPVIDQDGYVIDEPVSKPTDESSMERASSRSSSVDSLSSLLGEWPYRDYVSGNNVSQSGDYKYHPTRLDPLQSVQRLSARQSSSSFDAPNGLSSSSHRLSYNSNLKQSGLNALRSSSSMGMSDSPLTHSLSAFQRSRGFQTEMLPHVDAFEKRSELASPSKTLMSSLTSVSSPPLDREQVQELLSVPLTDWRKISRNVSQRTADQSKQGPPTGHSQSYVVDMNNSSYSSQYAETIDQFDGGDNYTQPTARRNDDSRTLLENLYKKLQDFDTRISKLDKPMDISAGMSPPRLPRIETTRFVVADEISASPNELLRLPGFSSHSNCNSSLAGDFKIDEPMTATPNRNVKALAAAADAGEAFGNLIGNLISKQSKSTRK